MAEDDWIYEIRRVDGWLFPYDVRVYREEELIASNAVHTRAGGIRWAKRVKRRSVGTMERGWLM